MKKTFILLLTAFGLAAGSARAATITIDFENNSITGGNLVLLASGNDAVDDFSGDRFDELSSASFEIQNIAGVGTLGITATALLDDLNITGDGLQDGPSGYDTAGEGTSFVFDRDVTITALDWVSFTSAGSDSVTLRNGGAGLGTFSEGDSSGGIDFGSTNPSTMSIAVSSGDAFNAEYAGGDYYLGQMTLEVVPEPGTLALASLAALAVFALHRRRR